MSALDRERELIRLERSRLSLREIVHDALRQAILSGQYPQNHRLAEVEVAESLGVSRTPVREAFRKLELEGLVQHEPGRGVTVTHLSTKDMLEVYSLMVALEGMAARLAAEQITEEGCQRLRQLLEALEEAQDAGDEALAATHHRQFNELIFNMTGNSRLLDLLKLYNEYIERTRARSWDGRLWQVKEEHRALVSAICRGDGSGAERIMRQHVEHSRAAYLARMEEGE